MSDAHQWQMKPALSVAASIVLGALAVFAFLLVVLGVVARPGHDGISRVAGHPMLTVLSGSMTPVFRPGDLVVDDAVPADKADQLVSGDIITFHVPGSATNLITHKIVAVKHQDGGVSYQTRGVANNAPDPELVQPSQVVGTYRNHIPMAGYLLQGVQKKTVFFLLILIPLLYLGLAEIAKRLRKPEPSESKDRVLEAEAAPQETAPAANLPTTEPDEHLLTPSAAIETFDVEPAPEPVLVAAAAATYSDAISALRRRESGAWLFERPANRVTGEGGDASV